MKNFSYNQVGGRFSWQLSLSEEKEGGAVVWMQPTGGGFG